jgi:hypothetical protein
VPQAIITNKSKPSFLLSSQFKDKLQAPEQPKTGLNPAATVSREFTKRDPPTTTKEVIKPSKFDISKLITDN